VIKIIGGTDIKSVKKSMLSRLGRGSAGRRTQPLGRGAPGLPVPWGSAQPRLLARYLPSMTPKESSSQQISKPQPPLQQNKGTTDVSASRPQSATKEEKKSIVIQVKDGLVHVGHVMVDCIRNPKQTWDAIKKEAKHYWVGTKLLWVEIKVAREICGRIASGHGMSRRERMQLIRTTMDLFRLVPLAIFVIVPFMELLLPVALKLFPNMLPSTFQDKLKKEEGLKMELQMRLAVAGFFQETLTEMANKKREEDGAGSEGSAGKDVLEFIEKARLGEPLPNDTVIRMARLFKDELTLANINRPQLVSMCQYMGLPPFGADAFLRFQLRTKLRGIKEDDRRILWEGIDSLTVLELREACNERGMRTLGLSEYGYKRQLQEWLDLSIQKNIPISLLIMSRAFLLTSNYSQPEEILKSSMSSLDSDIINEVVLAVAKPDEESSIEIKVRKLESLEFQSDMIREERDDKEEAKQSQKKATGGESGERRKDSSKPTSGADSIVSPILAPVAPVIEKVVEKVTAVTQAVIKTAATATGQVAQDVANSVVSASDAKGQKTSSEDTATKAPPSSPIVEEKTKELSATEIQILGDLARGPSLDREKAELAKIEARVEATVTKKADTAAAVPSTSAFSETKEADGSTASSAKKSEVFGETLEVISDAKSVTADSGKQTSAKAEVPVPDPSMARMQSALNSMVGKLKDRITDTEKALTDKLPKLDTDGDGELSSDELKGAIQTILKRAPTDKEAEQLVTILDKDGDGKVSVAELVKYAEDKVRNSEVSDLEQHVKEKHDKHDSKA